MRAIFSYGVASAILVAAGAWFATGTLVAGGNGPDKGERPLISVLEGQENGPLYKTLGAAGILAEHPHPAVDPHLTIAERNAIMVADTNAAAVKVRTQVFQAEPMQIDVPLRGRTKAKATITSAAETTGTVSKARDSVSTLVHHCVRWIRERARPLLRRLVPQLIRRPLALPKRSLISIQIANCATKVWPQPIPSRR
jgi:hypothetical protein